VYHRAFAGIPREREGRGRALRRTAFLPSRRADEAARRRAPLRVGAGADPRPLPDAPQPRSAAREGRRRPLQPSPPQAVGLRRLDARPRAGGHALVGVFRRLRGPRRLREGFAGVARRPRPEVVPRVAARALPRLRIAVHRRRPGARAHGHARGAARGLGAPARAGRGLLRRRPREPPAQVAAPRPSDPAPPASDSASRLLRAARPRARVLRGAARPARDGVHAGGGRHRSRPRPLAPRRGGTHPRPRGQGRGRRGHADVPDSRRHGLRGRRGRRGPGHAPGSRAQRVRPPQPRGTVPRPARRQPCPARAPSRPSRSRAAASS
jgi:hypothetical protein